MSKAPYGNDPSKIERYKKFWSRADATRPLVGFTLVGWFPFGEFAACRNWSSERYLTPDDRDAFNRALQQIADRSAKLVAETAKPDGDMGAM